MFVFVVIDTVQVVVLIALLVLAVVPILVVDIPRSWSYSWSSRRSLQRSR